MYMHAGTLCFFEVQHTVEEWNALMLFTGRDVDTVRPKLLQDCIPRKEWSSATIFDMLQDVDGRTGGDRKFYVCDGNHRIWVLKMLAVSRHLLTLILIWLVQEIGKTFDHC
jgi:hypothetical protein